MEKYQNAGYQSSDNLLNEFYNELLKTHRAFKTRVLKDCRYSPPTYYRKVRGKGLSNADRDKIICIKDECLQHLEIISTYWKVVLSRESA